MTVSKAQQRAVSKYTKENYDKILLTVPKGRREIIKAAAKSAGESANAYIAAAVEMRMGGQAVASPHTDSISQGVILPLDALEAAETAAGLAGETVEEYVARSVRSQVERDKITRKLNG